MLLIQLAASRRLAMFLFGVLVFSHTNVEGQQEDPQSLEPGLSIQRFASEPDLVTPTGIDVAPDGRVL